MGTAFDSIIGMDSIVKQVLPTIVELANPQDTKWRVRLAIIENTPVLSQELGKDAFNDKLSDICLQALKDSVYAIREAACNCISKLVVIFGADWMTSTIVPKMNELASDGCYLKRLTCLQLIGDMIDTGVDI